MNEAVASAPRRLPRWIPIGLVVIVLAAAIGFEIWLTTPVRQAVRTYTELISAANRRDLPAARALCTDRYLAAHPIRLAAEGGMVGLPRNIHKNFQAWKEGAEVWLCPTNRVGPVLRFVRESEAWKFDGFAGQLMPGGKVVPMETDLDTP